MNKLHIVSITIVLLIITLILAGCTNPVRFAPTEPQKEVALKTHLNALAVNASGAEANTPATKQLVEGTAVSLNYIGVPASPEIKDYEAALSSASADAARRPTIEKISGNISEGLSLAAQLAILFGVGGCALGGKKVLDWVKLAKAKNKALAEIINGNELLKNTLAPSDIMTFGTRQNEAQSVETKRIVKDIKLGV